LFGGNIGQFASVGPLVVWVGAMVASGVTTTAVAVGVAGASTVGVAIHANNNIETPTSIFFVFIYKTF